MGAAEEAVLALVEGVVAEESIAEDGEHFFFVRLEGRERRIGRRVGRRRF